MRREYEQVTCPGCSRRIAAYVPRWGDGSDVKLVPHKVAKGKRTPCPASNRLCLEYTAALRAK